MRGLLAAALLLAGGAPARAEHERGGVSIQPRGGGGAGRGGRPSAVSPGGAPAGAIRGGGFAGARSYSPPVIIKMRRVQVPQPRRPEGGARIAPTERPFSPPARDDRGAILRQRPATRPPAHTSVAGDRQLVRSIESGQRVEIVPRHYYWHDVGGTRYCHYFDGRAHWYGFYRGPRFYWTRYWTGFWWWYDPIYFRWVYWWNGYWWWPGPGGVVYAYVDNNYYPYQEGSVIVKSPEVGQPPAQAPSAAAGQSWKSPDGSRMVQVAGAQGEAYLYDTSGREPSFIAYLASGVKQARFSGGTRGKPLRILLDFNDGAFALYDREGRALDVKSPDESPAAQESPRTSEESGLPGPPPEPPSSPSGPASPPPQPPSGQPPQ